MGSQRITEVIDALQSMGIRADRGFPGKGMPYPDAPVVAVNLQELRKDRVTLAIHVYCSVEFSGIVCEDLSMDIADLLEALGAECTVGNCGFDGKSGLFSIRILAAWDTEAEPEIPFTVQVGANMLPFVTAFSAKRDRKFSMVAGDLAIEDDGWFITVTELLPLANMPEVDRNESFVLTLSRRGGTESYTDCRWSELYYEPTAEGMLRRRVARCWGERVIAVG